MSDITLEWFFQIPGLFITIGVLLILVALLVLIIGSSKARKKKDEEITEGSSVLENPAANTTEPVNVIDNNNQDTLMANDINVVNGINNMNTSINNTMVEPTNEINSVIEPVLVSNNDNIMPVSEDTPSIVTPVNIDENIKNLQAQNESDYNTIISEPVINKDEITVVDNSANDFVNDFTPTVENNDIVLETSVESIISDNAIDNNIELTPIKPTMAPVFSSDEINSVKEETLMEVSPVEPILKSTNNISNENNIVNIDDNNNDTNLNVVEPVIKPVMHTEQTATNNNVFDNSIIAPVPENVSVEKTPVENTEIEEIL